MEDRRQFVGAEAGVLADAAVVLDGRGRAFVAVEPVRHAPVQLGAGEADPRVGAVAERLVGRAAAAAQRHVGPAGQRLAARVGQPLDPGHQVRAVVLGRDAQRRTVFERDELGLLGGRVPRPVGRREADRQLFERRRGLADLRREARLGAQLRRVHGQIAQPLAEEHPGRALVREQMHVAVVAEARPGGDARHAGRVHRQLGERLAQRPQHDRHRAQRRARQQCPLVVVLLGVGEEAQQHQQHGVVGDVEQVGHRMRRRVGDHRPAAGVVVVARHRVGRHRPHRRELAPLAPRRLERGLVLEANAVEHHEVRVGVRLRGRLALLDDHLDRRAGRGAVGHRPHRAAEVERRGIGLRLGRADEQLVLGNRVEARLDLVVELADRREVDVERLATGHG